MKFSNLLVDDLIFINQQFTDIDELYQYITKKLSQIIKIDQQKIKNAIKERDKLGFPGFDYGFAIPHGRLPEYNDLLIAIVKLSKPITVNEKTYDFFFIIITNTQGSNIYLKTLSTIVSFIKNYNKELKSISEKNELIEFIKSKDVKITEPLKVSEIMDKNFDSVRLDSSISETLDIMKKHNKDFLPVVDNDGKYKGKISVIDILKLAYPPYVLSMTNLSFLSDYRAYEDFEKKEATTKVKDLYVESSKGDIIFEDTSIIELGFIIVKNNLRKVFVVNKENKIVGVVDPKTLLDTILRT
ncbi:MAG TPA: PTS sugar transporter subunit IIA [Spirochaetota bacterium]|nr:PTS sugar transporter subunit IIA [Spirochaetota bacterium]HOM38088.1 PTS sugar transporter subunit IIA [Spirochaetota bacterium]HPQ48890.1 PTS sugar transporter subunit IIA [Spirochaetota bacterium]